MYTHEHEQVHYTQVIILGDQHIAAWFWTHYRRTLVLVLV